ncbi:MAG: NAD(P)-dependent oxidoreductase [Burkholderiales bacterium]|nr:NAD(P)-dependent oxidoreductase [Burkholderiales bacterium]
MKLLVTGSAGRLGEALMLFLRERGLTAVGLDTRGSRCTDAVGSITDAALVRRCMAGVDAVLHTATLHAPNLATHSRQAFVDTNVSGTLSLLEAALAAGARRFICTSSTSVFGAAMHAAPGAPAVWVTEQLTPQPKNIYGASKLAAEALCEMMHVEHGLACVVLRTARFFPEGDDNVRLNELLYRRAALGDVVDAHWRAVERAPAIGFGRFIVSAATPFTPQDCAELGRDVPALLARRVPQAAAVYARLGWRLPATLDRVYDSSAARRVLGWQPKEDFASALATVGAGPSWATQGSLRDPGG